MSSAQAGPMLSPHTFLRGLRPGLRIFVAGCAGEPLALLDAAASRPEALAGATFMQLPIAGVNRRDLSLLAPLEALFMTPELRAGLALGRVRYRPLHYSESAAYLSHAARCDMAWFRCSAPRGGRLSLALAHDFIPSLAAAGAALVGVVDPDLPFVLDGVTFDVTFLHALIDGPSPSPELPPERGDEALTALGRHAALLLRPGDTLQAGIGAAVNAVLAALGTHRDIALHTGMIGDAAMALVESGVIARAVTGVALGSAALYARLGAARNIAFRPVSHTHDAAVLAGLPRLVAVNGAVEIGRASCRERV